MILADTNIIIDYWKNPDDKLTEIFEKEDIAICGVIQAELLHGARSEKEIDVISEAISCFEMLSYNNQWRQLGKMLYQLRISGITVPFTDAIIAQIAINNKASILTNDKHFSMIKTVLPELSLIQV